MPCYTIKKTSVNVSGMDLAILLAGLKEAGFDARLDKETLIFSRKGSYLYHNYHKGTLTIAGGGVEETTAEVKRAYSAQVVRQTATRFGWKLSEKPNQFIAQKRR